MRRIVPKVRIPKTISNVKVTYYNKDIVDVNFSILEIL